MKTLLVYYGDNDCTYVFTYTHIFLVVVSFGMASYSFAEDDTSASVDITLNQAHNAPLSVDVISEDLTAIG